MPIPEKPGRQEPVFYERMGKWNAHEYLGGFLSVHAQGDTPEEANANLDKLAPTFPALLAKHLEFLKAEGIDPVTRKKVHAQ